MLRVLDLFSGIGGFSLGLKRAGGFKTVAYCEIDPYCQAVLLARMRDGWLDTAPIHSDITKLDGKPWRGRVDLICGGFPCQDISIAGKRSGVDGEHSGLWREYARLIREIRPRYVFVENVPALLGRGLGRVLGDVATRGLDAEWDCVPAASFGADHIRDRVWIVANAHSHRQLQQVRDLSKIRRRAGHGFEEAPPDTVSSRLQRRVSSFKVTEHERIFDAQAGLAVRTEDLLPRNYWSNQPLLGRGVHGIPNRVDRLRVLGNAVVPQVVTWIGNGILEVNK